MAVRAVVEPGKERSVAIPGLARMEQGREVPELALEALEPFHSLHRPVAQLAGMTVEFDAAGPLEVVADRVGTGSTDFWGISVSPSLAPDKPHLRRGA